MKKAKNKLIPGLLHFVHNFVVWGWGDSGYPEFQIRQRYRAQQRGRPFAIQGGKMTKNTTTQARHCYAQAYADYLRSGNLEDATREVAQQIFFDRGNKPEAKGGAGSQQETLW